MSSVQRWMKFFLAAGIPDVTAATYATNFANNRIEMSMLMDLNKDYLKDLEINLLGDIILVLKYAKKVSDKQNSDRVLGDQDETIKKTKVESVPASLRPLEPERKVTSKEPVNRKPVKSSTETLAPAAVGKTVKTVKAKHTESDSKKDLMTSRLGPKIEEDDSDPEPETKFNSVFNRLGDQDKIMRPKAEKDSKASIFERLEPVKKEVKGSSSESRPERNFISTKPLRSNVDEKSTKSSAFDRLDISDSTQVCRVSSTNEQLDSNPGRGILKQRGVKSGPGLVKSKSASSIISLKPLENVKKKARVSFGENDIRCVSPRPVVPVVGIKARLGVGAASDEQEDSDADEDTCAMPKDLRQNLTKARTKGAQVMPAESTPVSRAINSKASSPKINLKVKMQPEEKPKVPVTVNTKKKYYIVRTLSDGTKQKTEVQPDDPLFRKLSERDGIASASTKFNKDPPLRKPAGVTRQHSQDLSSRQEKGKLQLEQLKLQSRVIKQEQKITNDLLREGLTMREERAARIRREQEEVKRRKLEERDPALPPRQIKQEVKCQPLPELKIQARGDSENFQTLAARATKLSSQQIRERVYEDEQLAARQLERERAHERELEHRQKERQLERARELEQERLDLELEKEKERQRSRVLERADYAEAGLRSVREAGIRSDGRRDGAVKRRHEADYYDEEVEERGPRISVRFPDQSVASRYDDELEEREQRVKEKQGRIQVLESTLEKTKHSLARRMPDRISSRSRDDYQSYDDDLEVVRLSDVNDSRGRRGYKGYNEVARTSGGGGGTMRADQESRPASERLARTRERSRSPVRKEVRYPREDESRDREETVYSRLGPRSSSSY